ncbi:MAG: HPF/RaiA family ribosome-associated protein, partial [Allorhizobium sp.]
DAVTKYFDGGYSGQVVVTKSQSRFAADCLVHLDTGANLHAAGEANDPQVAFDTAFERVEKRLRRYKRKLKDHHAGEAQNASIEVAYTVMDSVDDDHEELPDDYAPTIVAESTKKLRTMSVASAVMALDMTDDPVLLFRNPGSEQLNIVYRRNDGNIGWIDSANIKG